MIQPDRIVSSGCRLSMKESRMTRTLGPVGRWALAVFLVGAAVGWSGPEVISLKDGHGVTGEVVAEKPNALYVDLGFDVLRVPRDQIVARGAPGTVAAVGVASTRNEDVDPSRFFDSHILRSAPVKE